MSQENESALHAHTEGETYRSLLMSYETSGDAQSDETEEWTAWGR